ncbi:hypothetical protein KKD52_14865 [Myxococcota bacterium]|nr:hypothetical protein [Myxococcota bacterium]MBU1511633.1 hypothetical protein [Myxococcota bacterium]
MFKLLSISCLLGLFVVSCDDGTQKKTEITQALCEGITNRTDCEAAGCTYTCGMVLTKVSASDPYRKCLKRRHAGVCLAIIPLVRSDTNNQDYEYSIPSNTTGWFSEEVMMVNIEGVLTRYMQYFRYENHNDYPVELQGNRDWAHDFGDIADPCSVEDPDETLFPWEGSCETDWWSDTMWDDVLPR